MNRQAHFFDLGEVEDGLALVCELVERDWSALPQDDRDDLVQEGYLALEQLRANYDQTRSDSFTAYARTTLRLRLRDGAKKLRLREALAEDEQLERLESAPAAERARLAGLRRTDDRGWFELGRAPSESGERARLEARTHWFGASSLPEVAAVHSGEGYRIHEQAPTRHGLASLGSQAQLLRGFQ